MFEGTLGRQPARARRRKPVRATLLEPARPARYRMLTVASFASMLLLWIALTGAGVWPPVVEPVFLPSPLGVIETFLKLMRTGYQGQTLGHHLMISLFRFGMAFVFCVAVGVPVGLLMGMRPTVQALLDPPIEITRPIPKLLLLPLLIIWFGIGEVSKIVVIILAVLPMLSISAMQAVRGVSRRKIQAAYSLGADDWTVFRRVLLPASLPGIFTAIRVSLGVGITMLVGAEMIATSDGLAWIALSAADFILTDVVLVAVLLMAAIGFGLEMLARLVERRVVHWSGKEG
jgi:taurine transport system permease protein